MELHCTLISPDPANLATGQIRRELVVDTLEDTPGQDVAEVLHRQYGTTGCTVEGIPLEGLMAGRPPLVNGAVLVAGGAGSTRSGAPPPLSLVIHGGPAAGTVVPLNRGTLRIGRAPSGPGPRLALPDPELSRDHAVIEVTDAAVVVCDARSANGVWLGGLPVHRAEVTAGQPFRIGSSICALAFADEDALLDSDAGSGPHAPLRVARQVPPPRRAAIITMAVLPLIMGVAMALATGMWMFLAFTAVSAVSVLLPMVEGRAARRDFQRRLRAAVDDDAARRRRRSPDLGLLARSPGVAPRHRGLAEEEEDGGVHVRLGTADQPAGIDVEPADTRVVTPRIVDAPLTAAVRGALAIEGGAAQVEGLLRSVVLQLAVLPAAERVRIAVAGGTPELRLAARFLPRTAFLPAGAAQDSLDAWMQEHARAVLVVLPGQEATPEGTRAAVRQALARGWPVVAPADQLPGPPDALVRLGASAAFACNGTLTHFAPDLMPADAFEAAGRRTGRSAPSRREAGLPDRCALAEFVRTDPAGVAAAWAETLGSPGVRIPLGKAEGGPVILDLLAHGPHLLVAGTTGSGKSEFLRSLVAAAAATHAPDRLTFLFVDFKGGSGLEPLAGLPHCVGLVTDLAEGGMDRTLASLSAELKRRERILRRARAADLGDYTRLGGLGLPRLVVVIDEFRMLVEEAPAALAELMRVATVGRSLGMHLVMATQRPQGALSADIRANVTTSVVLRMQHDAESVDVLGSPVAARIPVGRPGRAFFAVGGGDRVAFQSASLALTAVAAPCVRVMDAHAWPTSPPGAASEGPPTASEAARPLVEATASVWAARGDGEVRRPVAPPLPPRLSVAAAAAFPRVASTGAPGAETGSAQPHDAAPPIHLGLVDLPHEQRLAPLTWDPGTDSHLALVGPSGSGASDALAAVVDQLADSPHARHLYLLDGDGSLGRWRAHPRVGAHVCLGDLRRGARVITRLGEECAARLGPAARAVPLVLVVSGWGGWVSALRHSPQSWAEEGLADLVRDGHSAGICVAASGDRELAASRMFGGMPGRLFFPLGATDEARLSWPRLPPMALVRGRAAAVGTIVKGGPFAAQCCALPDAPPAGGSAGAGARPRRRARAEPAPFRIVPLPTLTPAAVVSELATRRAAAACDGTPDLKQFALGADGPAPERVSLLVGLGGDEAEPLALRLTAGEALLVLGARESGKSTFLAALPAMNPTLDFLLVTPELRLREGEAALEMLTAPRRGGSARSRTVLLVDDADQLDPTENQLLSRLLEAGASVVAAAGYSPTLYARSPLALAARSTGTGIVIAPRAPGDGDVFGVRLDVPGRVPPGRAIAITEGRQVDVQLGYDAPSAPCRDGGLPTPEARPRRRARPAPPSPAPSSSDPPAPAPDGVRAPG